LQALLWQAFASVAVASQDKLWQAKTSCGKPRQAQGIAEERASVDSDDAAICQG